MSGYFSRHKSEQSEDDEDDEGEAVGDVQSTSFRGSKIHGKHSSHKNGVNLIGTYLTRPSFTNPSYVVETEDDYDQITASNTQITIIDGAHHFTPDSSPCANHQFKLNGSCICEHNEEYISIQHQRRKHVNGLTSHFDHDNNDRRLLRATEFPMACLTPESTKKVTKSFSSII